MNLGTSAIPASPQHQAGSAPLHFVFAGSQKQMQISIGDLLCLVPQQEVCSVESVSDLLPVDALADTGSAETNRHSVAALRYAQQIWPVYCLSEQMQFLSKTPMSRRACLVLTLGRSYFGLLCDDAKVLQQSRGKLHALPRAMQLAHSPLLGLMQMDGQLACMTSAAQLARYASSEEYRT